MWNLLTPTIIFCLKCSAESQWNPFKHFVTLEVSGTMGSIQLCDMKVNQALLCHVRCQDCTVSSDYAMGWTTKKTKKGWQTSLLQNVQNSSGAHPASYSVGMTVSCPRDKVAEAWRWPVIPSCVEVKDKQSYISIPHVQGKSKGTTLLLPCLALCTSEELTPA